MTDSSIADVIVVGSGVAGSTAAALLAEQGRRVLLIEASKSLERPGSLHWLNPNALPILHRLADFEIECTPLKSCTLHSADFAKCVAPELSEQRVSIVDRSDLIERLLLRFEDAPEQRLVSGRQVLSVDASEEIVKVHLDDGMKAMGRFLLIASGAQCSRRSGAGGLSSHRQTGGDWSVCYTSFRAGAPLPGQVHFVLGLPENGLACVVGSGDRVTVLICLKGNQAQLPPLLLRVSQQLHEREIISSDWPKDAMQTHPRWIPSGGSLEMESHVGKRSLLIGQAGGFVSAYSRETLYPAIWSASLGADVIHEALGSKQPQDTLREFESIWRTHMADHMRLPNTDPQALLSLVFSNQEMANRICSALLLGANF